MSSAPSQPSRVPLPSSGLLCHRQWLSAHKEQAAELPRAALACRLCKGVLLLGPDSLRQHLESKKHRARRGKRGQDFEPICFAAAIMVRPVQPNMSSCAGKFPVVAKTFLRVWLWQDDARSETHRERLERLKVAVTAPSVVCIESKTVRKKRRRNAPSQRTKRTSRAGSLKQQINRNLIHPTQPRQESSPVMQASWVSESVPSAKKQKVSRELGWMVPHSRSQPRQAAKRWASPVHTGALCRL